MPRNANSKAYVSAAFNLEFSTGNVVTGTPVLAYTGISSSVIRATQTEDYLVGKDLSQDAYLQVAMSFLDSDLTPEDDPALPSGNYRKSVGQSLFYKVIEKHHFLFCFYSYLIFIIVCFGCLFRCSLVQL